MKEKPNSMKLWKAHPLSKLNLQHTSDLFSMNPKPFHNEIVSSWIYRLARENFFSFVKFLRNFVEIDFDIMKNSSNKQYWKFDLDTRIPNELLNALSKKTGLPIEQIIDLSLKEWENKIFELFITRKGTSCKKLGGLRFCLLCLKEDEIPYYRKYWKLKFITCCEKHQVYLYDRCTNQECGKPVNISLMKYEKSIKECPYCGIDLSKSKVIKIPQNDSYVEIIKKLKLILKNNTKIILYNKGFSSYDFFEGLYFLCRFIIKYFPFKDSKFRNHFVITSGLLDREKEYLSQRDYVFENMQISQLVLKIAYGFLMEYPDKLKKFISNFQAEFNYETQKNCPKILKDFRFSKGHNPEITKKRILTAIYLLIKKGKKITYDNIALEAKCAHNFYLSHPHLREIVDFEKKKVLSNMEIVAKRRKRKSSNEININPQEVINAINKLKKENKKVTYKAVSTIIKENYWNLKERPEIVKIIRPHLSQSTKKKYFYTSNDIHNTIDLIRKEGLEISINEVCRKLKCHKTFFRNNPNLKKIILKAKKKDLKKVLSSLPKNGNYEELSIEAKEYEQIFIKYKNEMEQLGKNWNVAMTGALAKKLGIPPKILIEIKLKYCPFTRKVVRNKKKKELLNKNKSNIEKEIELSEEAKQYEKKFVDYIKEMEKKRKSWKSANNKLLTTKLDIPFDFLKEIKKKYL